jgi:GWxTD domain-containing protein
LHSFERCPLILIALGQVSRLLMSHPLFFSAVKCKLKLSTVGRNISLVTILFVIVGQSFATGIRDLPSKYREWLQKDVAYIITDEEKDAFLNMAADADRDQFITRFWEVRNPTPGAPSNPYREEHYRRLEYANQYFGHEAHGGMYGFAGEIGPKDRAVYSHDRARPGRRVSASSINSRES